MSLLEAGLAMLEQAGTEALEAPGPEEAMHALARGCFDLLGDREAHLRPGALKEGERQFFVAGAFFVVGDPNLGSASGVCVCLSLSVCLCAHM